MFADLKKEIEDLLNKHCRENVSNTPDFILAQFLLKCLYAFEEATHARDKWYSAHLQPGNKYFYDSEPADNSNCESLFKPPKLEDKEK
mgnify:CR=1 FL=1